MTKFDIINKIIENTGLSKKRAESGFELLFSTIKNQLAAEETIAIRRFGVFSVRNKNKRIGRNPKTGQEAEITARKVVTFKAGKYFRNVVNNIATTEEDD